MKNFNLIASILGRPWLIDKTWTEANLPLIQALLTGQQFVSPYANKQAFSDDDESGQTAADDQYMRPKILEASSGTVRASFYRSFDEAPEGSLALIPVIGPIAKYYECGVPGSADMVSWIAAAEKSPKISGIILKIDSPGGMVDGTATLGDAVKNATKPTTAFIDDGMAASAAYWIASNADEIILSQPTDAVGSIGVYTRIADYTGFFEKHGIKLHEIYAPQSTEKNLDYKEALKGKYDLVLDDLRFLADRFIQVVKDTRGDKLNLDFADPFKGKMFYADDAIKAGLADKIGSLDIAVESTYSRVGTKKATKNSSFYMFGNKYPQLHGLKGVEAKDISEETLEAVNAELKTNGVSGVKLVNVNDLASFEQALTEAESAAKTATSEKDKAVKDLADLQSTHQQTKSELDKLKSTDATKPATLKADADKPEPTANDDEAKPLSHYNN